MDDLSSQLNGKKALFSKAPWLDVRRPKDIAPLIFKGFQRRRCSVSKALENNYWITQINMQDGLSLEHSAIHQPSGIAKSLANGS
jgi:hypothetical protein